MLKLTPHLIVLCFLLSSCSKPSGIDVCMGNLLDEVESDISKSRETIESSYALRVGEAGRMDEVGAIAVNTFAPIKSRLSEGVSMCRFNHDATQLSDRMAKRIARVEQEVSNFGM